MERVELCDASSRSILSEKLNPLEGLARCLGSGWPDAFGGAGPVSLAGLARCFLRGGLARCLVAQVPWAGARVNDDGVSWSVLEGERTTPGPPNEVNRAFVGLFVPADAAV